MATDFTISRGDTITLNASVVAAGSVYSLAGVSMWFTAKYNYSDADGAAVFQKKLGSGITIVSAANGTARIVIAATDTNGLPNSKTLLLWDLQLKDSSGSIYTVASGNLIVLPDVTRSTT